MTNMHASLPWLLAAMLAACGGASGGPAQAGPSAPAAPATPLPPASDGNANLDPDMLPPRIQCARVPCGDTPPASARSRARELFEQYPGFAFDPAPAGALLTPALHALLQRDQACADEHGMCAIGADPWSAAQDGQMGEALGYRTLEVQRRVMGSPTHARVEVCFRFILEPQSPQQRCATLAMERRLHGPWQVDDLVDAQGQSLRQLLLHADAPQTE